MVRPVPNFGLRKARFCFMQVPVPVRVPHPAAARAACERHTGVHVMHAAASNEPSSKAACEQSREN